MQAADIPTYRFPIAWGSLAGPSFIRTIPVNSQIGIQDGAASLQTGFPPLNMTPLGAGGVPPFGQDHNGILNAITEWSRWYNAGGIALPYSNSFQADISGYPKGAVVASATTDFLYWISTADNNVNNPDTGGADWIPIWMQPQARIVTASGAFTISVTDQAVGLNRTAGVATSSAALPSTNLFTGFEVAIADLAGNFNAFPVTISAPLGHNIAGQANIVLNVNRQTARFRYYGSSTFGVQL